MVGAVPIGTNVALLPIEPPPKAGFSVSTAEVGELRIFGAAVVKVNTPAGPPSSR